MKTFNVHEAKTKFSSVLALVTAGEEVIVAKAGKPVAIISPYKGEQSPREFGPFRGQVKVGEAFFEAMDDAFLRHFQ